MILRECKTMILDLDKKSVYCPNIGNIAAPDSVGAFGIKLFVKNISEFFTKVRIFSRDRMPIGC